MDLATRKKIFKERFDQIKDVDLITRFEEFLDIQLSNNTIVAYTVQGKPLTKKMYVEKVKNTLTSVKAGDEAKADLKYIHNRILKKTKSVTNAKNVKRDIINASKNIEFIEQYQVDEFLGKPFRRIIVRHFRLIYFAENKSSIIILEVFDSYRNLIEIRSFLT